VQGEEPSWFHKKCIKLLYYSPTREVVSHSWHVWVLADLLPDIYALYSNEASWVGRVGLRVWVLDGVAGGLGLSMCKIWC